MAMSNITVKGITPALAILGAYQRFVYEDNLSSFQLDNTFIPTNLISSQTNYEMRNNTFSGFRWIHKTLSGETTGSLKLQSFVNASPTGTDLMLFGQDGTITISSFNVSGNINMGGNQITNLPLPFAGTDAASKDYVLSIVNTITLTGDISGTGTGSIATTFIANPTFTGTNYIRIPTGTTAQRPSSPSVGMVRCNTSF